MSVNLVLYVGHPHLVNQFLSIFFFMGETFNICFVIFYPGSIKKKTAGDKNSLKTKHHPSNPARHRRRVGSHFNKTLFIRLFYKLTERKFTRMF